MEYVFELPKEVKDILLLILKKHTLGNGMNETDFEVGKRNLLNSKVKDIEDFKNILEYVDF